MQQAPSKEDVLSQLETKLTYTDPQWLSLMHYKRSPHNQWISEADSSMFFLSATGKLSPRDELIALINIYFKAKPNKNHRIFCKFPARIIWLSKTFNLPEPSFAHCKNLNQWKSQFSTQNMSIAFTSAFMGNPASTFGHTFLRFFDKENDSTDGLLSATVNYSADLSESTNPVDYFYRGVLGGFSGVIDNLPYHRRIRRYVQNENRDIWEYYLDIAEDDIRLIILHAWEIKNDVFHYHFLDENCSYRALSIIAVAKPSLLSTKSFRLLTIPIDTIRVLDNAGLIMQTHHYPASIRVFNHTLNFYSAIEKKLAIKMAKGFTVKKTDTWQALEPSRKLAVVSLAMEYLNLLIQGEHIDSHIGQQRYFNFIKQRANFNNSFKFPDYPKNMQDDPLNRHLSSRFSISYGDIDHEQYIDLGFRVAGHDTLDISSGYQVGSYVSFLNFEHRFFENDNSQLQRLDLFKVASFADINRFFQPQSWSFQFSRQRKLIQDLDLLVTTIEGNIGYSKMLFEQSLLSLTLGMDLDYNGSFKNNVDLELNAEIALIGQSQSIAYDIRYTYFEYIENELAHNHKTTLGLSVPIASQQAIVLQGNARGNKRDNISIGYRLYF